MKRFTLFGLIVALLLGYVPAAADQPKSFDESVIFVDDSGEVVTERAFAPNKGWKQSPTFRDHLDSSQSPAAQQALRSWNKRTNAFNVKYRDLATADCENLEHPQGAITACSAPKHPEFLGSTVVWVNLNTGYITSARIWIFGDEQVSSTLVHEIGHAIGLRHNPNVHSIMASHSAEGQRVLASDVAGLRKMGYIKKKGRR